MIRLDVHFTLLINGGIHEKAQQHGCGPIDGHAHRSHRIDQIETGIQFLGIVEATNGNARIAYFSVNVGTNVGVVPVQSHAVKSR